MTGFLPDAHSRKVPVFVLEVPDLGGMRVGQRFSLPVLTAQNVAKGEAFRLTISARDVQAAGQPAGAFVNVQIMAIHAEGEDHRRFCAVRVQPDCDKEPGLDARRRAIGLRLRRRIRCHGHQRIDFQAIPELPKANWEHVVPDAVQCSGSTGLYATPLRAPLTFRTQNSTAHARANTRTA